jgi:hypothetical protein
VSAATAAIAHRIGSWPAKATASTTTATAPISLVTGRTGLMRHCIHQLWQWNDDVTIVEML